MNLRGRPFLNRGRSAAPPVLRNGAATSPWRNLQPATATATCGEGAEALPGDQWLSGRIMGSSRGLDRYVGTGRDRQGPVGIGARLGSGAGRCPPVLTGISQSSSGEFRNPF